jgi:rubrerythrin
MTILKANPGAIPKSGIAEWSISWTEEYLFTLTCLDCGTNYEGCFSNQYCPTCGKNKNILSVLKDEFIGTVERNASISVFFQ